jgi:putative transposase
VHAPRGQRPVIKAPTCRRKISAIAALSVSTASLKRNLFFECLLDANFNSARVIDFLHTLLRQIKGPIFLIWDNAKIHKSKAIRAFLAKHPRMSMNFLPTYAPELNPVEALWSYLKYGHLANVSAHDFDELFDRICNVLIPAKHNQKILQSFWKATPLHNVIIKNLAA